MLIKNGLISNEWEQFIADIRIKGELISEIDKNLIPLENEQVIDAAGKIVIPGGIDVHTHIDLDFGENKERDFYTGTVAAACGGTTTVIEHMNYEPLDSSISDKLKIYHGLAKGKAVIDYSFHGVINRVDDNILKDIKNLIKKGITSHKIYLTYGGKISHADILKLMEYAKNLGIIIAIHAENDELITYLRNKFIKAGKLSPKYHAMSRPPECEADAVNEMILFSEVLGDIPLYLVHISSGLSLAYVHMARQRGVKNIYVETCPQYLFLDDSLYNKADGIKFMMSPPLRDNNNREALLSGLTTGVINTIATDFCPFLYKNEKEHGKADFTKAPGGIPGIETRIPLMYSQIAKDKLDIGKFVSLCCTEPARLFGMYPQKGIIAVSSDADIVIIDPTIKRKIKLDMLHENCDYTPFEGIPVTGYPAMTISRGEVVVENGNFTGKKGRGKFIKRNLPILKA